MGALRVSKETALSEDTTEFAAGEDEDDGDAETQFTPKGSQSELTIDGGESWQLGRSFLP